MIFCNTLGFHIIGQFPISNVALQSTSHRPSSCWFFFSSLVVFFPIYGYRFLCSFNFLFFHSPLSNGSEPWTSGPSYPLRGATLGYLWCTRHQPFWLTSLHYHTLNYALPASLFLVHNRTKARLNCGASTANQGGERQSHLTVFLGQLGLLFPDSFV